MTEGGLRQTDPVTGVLLRRRDKGLAMKATKALKWACIASLCGGWLFQSMSCGSMVRQSLAQGTLAWVTGAVGSSVGDSGALTDLLLGVVTSPGSGN